MVLIARTFTMARLPGGSLLLFGHRLLLGHRLLHARGLALQVAEEVQLRAPDARRPHDVDLGDCRRVQREDALDALSEGHLADRERGACAAAVQTDDDPLENLDAFLVALAHLHVHAHGVARLHPRPIRQLRLLDLFHPGHDSPPAPRKGAPCTIATCRSWGGPLRPAAPLQSRQAALDLHHRVRRSPSSPAADPASAPAPSSAASAAPRRGAPTSARQAPSGPRTPPAACSAGNRAARARTNPRPPTVGRPRPQEPAGLSRLRRSWRAIPRHSPRNRRATPRRRLPAPGPARPFPRIGRRAGRYA